MTVMVSADGAVLTGIKLFGAVGDLLLTEFTWKDEMGYFDVIFISNENGVGIKPFLIPIFTKLSKYIYKTLP